MKKKLLSLLAAVCLAISLAPTALAAGTAGTCGALTWTLSNGALTIAGTGDMIYNDGATQAPWTDSAASITSVSIGAGVRSIADSALSGCTALTSVSLPGTLTKIGVDAFSGCSALTQIAIPGSVKTVGNAAFDSCTGLKTAVLAYGVESVGMNAFYGCTALESVSLPDSLTGLGEGVFRGCSSLVSAVIPPQITKLSHRMFYACSNLENVVLPSGLTFIGTQTFTGCSKLSALNLPDGVNDIGDYAFQGCAALTEMIIPEGVTYIGYHTFLCCTQLRELWIPVSVTAMGYDAFAACNNLNLVCYEGTQAQWDQITFEDPILSYSTIVYSAVPGTSLFTTPISYSQYGILARSSSGKPIADATVVYGEKSATTDKDGLAVFDRSDTETALSVSKTGYTTYSVKDTAGSVLGENGYEVIVLYTTGESKLRLSGATYQNTTGGAPSGSKTNILAGTKRLSLSSQLYGNFEIVCAATDPSAVSAYQLWQGDTQIAASSTGTFELTTSQFSNGGKVLVRVVPKSGDALDTKLNLSFFTDNTQGGATLSLGDELVFTVDESVPIIGGMKLKFRTPDCPVSFYVSGDTIHVGVNAGLLRTKKVDGKVVPDEESTKSNIETIKKTVAALSGSNGEADSSLESRVKSLMTDKDKMAAWGPVKVSVSLIGYGEGKFNKDGWSQVTSYICLTGKIKSTFQGPTTVLTLGPVVVPVTYSVKLSADGKLSANISYDISKNQLDGEAKLNVTPEIEPFGGVGVGAAVGIGVYGNAKIPFEFQIAGTKDAPCLNSVDVTGEAGLKAYLGAFEYKQAWAHSTWHVYPMGVGLSSVGNSETWLSGAYDAGSYAPADLSYLSGESEWLSGGAELASSATLTPLQTETYRNTQPLLGSVNSTPVMVWTKANATRGTYNAPYLVSSVYHADNDEWDAPTSVDGDSTADSGASLCTDPAGNSLWLVYQNENQAFSDNSGCTPDMFAQSSTVAVAKFDAASGKFAAPVTISGACPYSHSPSIAALNGTAAAVWVSNENPSYFGTNNTNALYYSICSSGVWGAPILLASGLNAVTELKVGFLNGLASAAVITDGDNNLQTTSDRILTYYVLTPSATPVRLAAGQAATEDTEATAVSAASFASLPGNIGTTLLWVDGGVLKSYNGTDTAAVIQDAGALAGGLTVLPDRIVYNGADTIGDTACSNLFALLHNTDGTWSGAVRLTDQSKYLQSYAAAEIGGTAYVAASQADVTIAADSVTDSCTLSWGVLNGRTDAAVAAVSIDQTAVAPGTTVPVAVDISNNGDTVLNAVTLKITDSAGNVVKTEDLTGLSIAPSAVSAQTIGLPFGTAVTPTDYTVTVAVAGDTDTSNDSAILRAGYSDLTVGAELVSIGGSSELVAKITNRGAAASGGTLSISAGGRTFASVAVDTLAQGESRLVEIDVTKKLLNGDVAGVVTLSVAPSVETLSELDNTTQVYAAMDYADSAEITGINAQSAAVKVCNTEAASVFLAVYDGSGRLVKTASKQVDVDAGTISFDLGLKSLPENWTAKAFVLSQTDSKPLCAASILTAGTY